MSLSARPQRGDRAGPEPRRQQQPRSARGHPGGRGEARQLDRGAADPDRADRRGQLPGAADQERGRV